MRDERVTPHKTGTRVGRGAGRDRTALSTARELDPRALAGELVLVRLVGRSLALLFSDARFSAENGSRAAAAPRRRSRNGSSGPTRRSVSGDAPSSPSPPAEPSPPSSASRMYPSLVSSSFVAVLSTSLSTRLTPQLIVVDHSPCTASHADAYHPPPRGHSRPACWCVLACARGADPILFKENDENQVIGTRLTNNPRGIQTLEVTSPPPSSSI